jgi:hypothetical protein
MKTATRVGVDVMILLLAGWIITPRVWAQEGDAPEPAPPFNNPLLPPASATDVWGVLCPIGTSRLRCRVADTGGLATVPAKEQGTSQPLAPPEATAGGERAVRPGQSAVCQQHTSGPGVRGQRWRGNTRSAPGWRAHAPRLPSASARRVPEARARPARARSRRRLPCPSSCPSVQATGKHHHTISIGKARV